MIKKFVTLSLWFLLIVSLVGCAGNWDDLNAQVVQAYQAGDYVKAMDFAEQTVNAANKEFGRQHPTFVSSMSDLALLYKLLGQYQQAEPLMIEVLALYKENLGLTHINTLISMSNLAGLYHSQGYYKQAVPLYVEALALSKETLGLKHAFTIKFMNNLASLYHSQGHNQQAELLYNETLALSKETLGLTHPDTLLSMSNLSILYQSQGHFEKAVLLSLDALALYTETLGLKHPDTLRNMINLAGIYQSQGHYEQAEPLKIKALALYKETLGIKHPDTIACMNNLAVLFHYQGRYKKAEALTVEVLALYKETLGLKHPSTLTSMDNLAGLYHSQGNYKQAESLYIETLDLRKETLGLMHPSTLGSMSNLAVLYDEQGRYEQAEPLQIEALEGRKETLGFKHPDTTLSMNNLAALYQSQGRYKLAGLLFVETLAIRKETLGLTHPDTILSMNNLAGLYAATQQYFKAEKLVSETIRSTADFLQQVLWGSGNKTRLAYLQQQKYNRDFYLTLFNQRNHPDNALEALNYSILNKGLLLQIASQVKALSRGVESPAVQKQIRALETNRKQLANLVLAGKGTVVDIQYFEELINRLEATLGQQIKPFQRAKLTVIPEQVIKTLDHQGLLIDYMVYQQFDYASGKSKASQLMALVVNPLQTPAVHLISLGDLKPIASLIERYRTILKSARQDAEFSSSDLKIGQQLYQALWSPLLPYLETNKTIYLIPDGILNLLPFAALIDPQGQYLISTTQVNLLSSGRELVLPPLTEKAGTSVIFAAPLYAPEQLQDYVIAESRNNSRSLNGLYFSPLPGALKEGQQLAELMQGKNMAVNHFQLAQATEQQISQVHSPRVLHLATHGYFLDDLPQKAVGKRQVMLISSNLKHASSATISIRNPLLRSGLAFSNANLGVQGQKQGDGTDGILSAEEALALDLAGTDLVVLSACETGIGQVQQGEGIYGLRRAFQEAGAKSVLSTLWSISDVGTQAFMQHFYSLFLNGTGAQEALKKTQLSFMQDKQWQHPFYWAPFVMTGL